MDKLKKYQAGKSEEGVLNDIMELALSFQKSRILLTAYELGLFTAVGDGEKTSDETARAIRTEKRATDRLMNALVVLGFLKKKEDLFANTYASLKFLVEGNKDFVKGLMHSVRMWDTWGTLTEAVKKGGAVNNGKMAERTEEWFDVFIACMHERAAKQAASIASLIGIPPRARILDVGGGSGDYSIAFARSGKGVSCVVFDLAQVTPITDEYVRGEMLSGSVKTVSGDYKTDDLGSGFDIVFLSAIIHMNSVSENIELIKKSADALKPGGMVIVQDFIMNNDRVNPPFGAIFALNMLVATEEGDTYTGSEVAGWMEKAGLSGVERKDTAFGTSLIIGTKK